MNSTPPLRSELSVHRHFAADYLAFHRILPLKVEENALTVATVGAPDDEVVADLERTFGATAILKQVAEDDLRSGIEQAYSEAESVLDLVENFSRGDEVSAVIGAEHDLRNLANQPPVIRFVNMLIREAQEAGASDIHVEATGGGADVRFRVDGVLNRAPAPPGALVAAVVSRIKLIADLDIAERRRPQDGRVRVRLEDRNLDLRISTMPTIHGESVVMRLLDQGDGPPTLDDLGMESEVLRQFRNLALRPHGIVLATGPTGSGKTTTLYGALQLRALDREKVITIEDPVEYQLQGVNQVPVNQKAGMTFAAGLRSILRQDPDVVMVGEMRDPETAEIAVQAAMTGHLVFSTVHTNDSLGALARLADLGVEPFLLAATIRGVLAQRLVRRICEHCRVSYHPDPQALRRLGPWSVSGLTLSRGEGCDRCRGSGYSGRVGLFEVLEMTPELQKLASGLPDSSELLREAAKVAGLVSLKEDGWLKVRRGITTVEEVARVVHS